MVRTCAVKRRQFGRPKKTLTEIVQKDCQAHKLNRDDAMDRKMEEAIRDDC